MKTKDSFSATSEEAIAYYKHSSARKDVNRWLQDSFLDRVKQWRENYRPTGGARSLSDLRPGPRTTLRDLVTISGDFIGSAGTWYTIALCADKEPPETALKLLNWYVGTHLAVKVVYEKAWSDLPPTEDTLASWVGLQETVTYGILEDLHVVLKRGGRGMPAWQGIEEELRKMRDDIRQMKKPRRTPKPSNLRTAPADHKPWIEAIQKGLKGAAFCEFLDKADIKFAQNGRTPMKFRAAYRDLRLRENIQSRKSRIAHKYGLLIKRRPKA